MRKLFYARLALSNLKKNARVYLPYLLSCMLTIAMTYILFLLPRDEGLAGARGEDEVRMLLKFGSFVVSIFAVIFLFYTSSFLTKRRKAEFGLLNVLGMEKKHIARMLFFETLFVGLAGGVGGLLLGFALSKAAQLLLVNLVDFEIYFGMEVDFVAALITLGLFAAIFLLIFANNVRQVHFASATELLRGSSAGEREPKAKWLLALLGLASLGTGSYMAVTITEPIDALAFFFVAVILVIVGTYCLFSAGSIVLLKALRKNKRYYYRPEHFISVSGMIYRMKQNAVGLANICVLSTMVLVMLSSTTSLFLGTTDTLMQRHPNQVCIEAHGSIEEAGQTKNCVETVLAREGTTVSNLLDYMRLNFACRRDGEDFITDTSRSDGELVGLNLMTLEDFNRLERCALTLQPGQVFASPHFASKMNLLGQKYEVLPLPEYEREIPSTYYATYAEEILLVVPDQATLEQIEQAQMAVYENFSTISYYYGFDLDASDEEIIELARKINDELTSRGASGIASTRVEQRPYLFASNGGLFFLGLLLGLLFIMATVLIMYYKQLCEGYDDKRRFAIMRKVGLEKREIRLSVRSQVLTMFYLPLGAACVHIAFAFPFITRLMPLVGLWDMGLFAACTLVSVAVFALFYAATYALTARVYYRIVGSD